MRKCMSFLAVVVVSGALLGAVAAMNCGFSVSVGRCVIEDNGSCLLILDDCPVVRSRKGAGKNPWMKLETGDQLLVDKIKGEGRELGWGQNENSSHFTCM